MNKRNKELAFNTVVLGVGQFIPKLIALCLLPILTQYLSKSEYGIYDYAISLSEIVIPIVSLQIHQAVFRYLIKSRDHNEKAEYISSSIVYVFCSFAFFSILFSIYAIPRYGTLTTLIIIFYLIFEILYILLGQMVRGTKSNINYSISVILFSFANLLSAIVFVASLKKGILGAIMSMAIGYLVACIYMVYSCKLYKYVLFSCNTVNKIKELLRFSIPIVPSSISLWVVNLSDRTIIINVLGASYSGIYAVANKIPALFGTAYQVFNLAWIETSAKVADEGDHEKYYSVMFSFLFRFLVGMMLVIMAITPIVFSLFVRGDYQEALLQIPLLYIGVFLNCFVSFYSGIYLALNRTVQVGISSFLGAVLNVTINLLLIKRWGLFAASLSTVLAFLIVVMYRAFDLNKIIKIQYRVKDILIGIFCLLITCLLLYNKGVESQIIVGIGAITYNYFANREILKKSILFFKNKM